MSSAAHPPSRRSSGAGGLDAALTRPEFFRDLLDNLSEGVYVVDRRRTIRYWNRGSEQASGYAAEDVVGRRCFDNILRHVDEEGRSLCRSARCPLARTMRDGQPRTERVWLHHADGHRVPVAVRAAPVRDEDGQIIGAIETYTDDSSRVAEQERSAELEQLALMDHLTGLPNRRYVEMALVSRLGELRRYDVPMAVAVADLDGLKQMNDSHGHDAGDGLLRMAAATLQANVRAGDIVGRFGGDEFVILLQHTDIDEAAATCGRLCTLLERASRALPDGGELRLTMSIGLTMARPEDGAEDVLRRADALLYASKGAGGGRVVLDR